MTQTHSVNILIVDDQPSNLLITQAVLQPLEHNIVTAKNGKEAIKKLNYQEFAAILLDVNMPEMDGFETAQKIRKNPKTNDIPILFVTGSESEEIEVFNGYNSGAVDYLIKPINPKILQAKVSVFIQLYQQKKQLQDANLQLEDRVEQRTKELEQINHSLQSKIKESHKLQKERHQIEQKIRESEALHRTILHSISDAVFITDAQGKFTFICPNSDIIFGYTLEEIKKIGNIKKLLHKDLIDGYNLEELEEINNIEHQIIDKFDCLHFLLITIKKVDIDQGTILYTCRDITERKQAQLDLEKRQTYFDALVKVQKYLLQVNAQTIFDAELLEPLGQVTQASKVFIYKCCVNDSYPSNDLKIEWCADEINQSFCEHQSDHLKLPQAFSFMRKKLLQGQIVSGIVADLPIKDRQLLEAENVKSFLVFPLKIMDKFYGFLGFVDCLSEKHWDSLALSVLWSVTADICSTLERIAIAEKLHHSQTRLQNIVNNTSDGLLVVDQKGIVQFLNPTAEALFDVSKEQLLGQYLGFLSAKKGTEIQIHQMSGKMVITEMRVTDIIWDQQPAFLAALRDITQRRHIEEKLQKSLRELYAMKYALDQASIVAITDRRGMITYVNDKFCEISQYSEEELIGTKHELVHSTYHPHEFWQHLWQTISKGKIWRGEIQNIAKGGHIYWVDTTIVPFLDAQGRPEQYLAIRFDITDRKQAEQSLQALNEDLEVKIAQRTENLAKTNEKLRQEIIEREKVELALRDSQAQLQDLFDKERELNQLKSQFIDIVSHEFRTPLTAILGYTELLTKYPDKFPPEKKQKHLQRIDVAGKQMKTLIEDVLCLSRADSGKIEFHPQPLDLITFCQDLIEELQIGLGKDHQLQLHYPDELAMIMTNLDKKLLQPILTNLLTNSIKYSPPQSQVDLLIEKQNEMIVFFIQDQGIGIPLTDQISLFESFHRADNVGDIQGTGLGLNIVQRYVNLHQGNIIFSSIINEGTTFRVALPLKS